MIPSTLDAVMDIVTETLGLGERRAGLTARTLLLGSMPELDSLAVVQLAMAIETEFGITIDDDDFGAQLFATIGSLADYVENRRLSAHGRATAAE